MNHGKTLFSFQSDDDDHDEYVHCSSCGQKLYDIKRRVSLFGGMERWNGMVEWNGGTE